MISGTSRRERAAEVAAHAVVALAALVGVAALVALLGTVLQDGLGRLSLDFLRDPPSRLPGRAGFATAILGTLWLMGIVIVAALPVGIGAAIYLEEFAATGRLTTLIETNIANLAGVPSIVYGILGLAFFVRGLGLGFSVLAGGLTMSLLVLPVVVIASREAIRAVPPTIRNAALALGATRWQAVRGQILPAALPGILTGCILAVSRAIGETAPLLLVGAVAFVRFPPDGLGSRYTAMPVQIFSWIGRPQAGFRSLAAAGIIVLLAILLLMNAAAVVVRNRYERRRWS
ncbi:MAG: phosphate ABC transporter permease PstA [Actinobacteria bacterium]|nr:phosphate ABC transporter permease PstA [Actinomycetota bacterium]